MKETDIPTPALVIDVETATRNAKRMADYAAAHRIKVRPHTKTHKSLRMARLQLDYGAIGLAVAKAGEAKVMTQDCSDTSSTHDTVLEPRTICARDQHPPRHRSRGDQVV